MVHDVSQRSLLVQPYEEAIAKKKKKAFFHSGKPKAEQDAREQEDTYVSKEEIVNRYVQYRSFGLVTEDVCRIISVDEIPCATEIWHVVIKIKVRLVCQYMSVSR